MRKLVLTDAASLLLGALAVQPQAPDANGTGDAKAKAKGKGGGKGGDKGGFVPKNLQVLNPATFPEAMQNFVQALDLADKGRCNFFHVEDRASDEKMQKVTARKMILMVRDINAHFEDGKQHVTCYTCHRGSITPATAP